MGSAPVERRVRPAAIVEIEIASDPVACRAHAIVSVQVDLFVFHAAPQPFDKHVVAPGTLAVHADGDVVFRLHAPERQTRELRALIRVEDVGLAVLRQSILAIPTASACLVTFNA